MFNIYILSHNRWSNTRYACFVQVWRMHAVLPFWMSGSSNEENSKTEGIFLALWGLWPFQQLCKLSVGKSCCLPTTWFITWSKWLNLTNKYCFLMAYTLSKILHAHVREEINLFNFFFFYNYKEEDVSLLNKPDEAWPPQTHLLYSLVNIAVRWWAFSDNYWYHAAELCHPIKV